MKATESLSARLRRHRHVWWVSAIQVENYRHGDETNVLHRCDCGKVKVEVINGGWTPAQLGLTPRRDA